jgi:uncharacterized protein (TIGR03118 family)
MLAILVAALALVPGQFAVRPLVSDRVDPELVNAWGLAAGPQGPWWVTNEARSSSTLYAGDGRKQWLTVRVPGGPTGIVYNGSRGFVVRAAGGAAGPARFLYACEDGMIRGWSPGVPHGWSQQTEVAVDASGSGAVFRGLAIARGRLYATDFHNARVLVFDSRWRRIVRRGAFADPSIPGWYAPFGIQAVGDRIFVTYAWRAPVNGNDAPSGGYVDEFELAGKLIARVGNPRRLDEPWGVAQAPRVFGRFGADLLVASFGSGRIAAYGRTAGGWSFRGFLPVRVPGVWGIAFGNGRLGAARTALYYAAGPHRWHGASEVDIHGALGAITARAASP